MDKMTLGGFGDRRRAELGSVLLDAVQSKRTLCLHRRGGSRNETLRFTNFLSHPAVSSCEMLVTAGRRTNQRSAGRHVLAIMDTTDVLFPSQGNSKRGFGLGSDSLHPGLFLHPVIGVDASHGGVIGLVDCIVLNRTAGKVSCHDAAGKALQTHKKRQRYDPALR